MTSRLKRIADHRLFPLPKVYVPFFGGLVAVASQGVATGQFDRAQLAQLVLVGGYALIGYAVPSK